MTRGNGIKLNQVQTWFLAPRFTIVYRETRMHRVNSIMEDPQTVGMQNSDRQPQMSHLEQVTSNGQPTGPPSQQQQTMTDNNLPVNGTGLPQHASRGNTSQASGQTDAGKKKIVKKTLLDKFPVWLSSSLRDKRKWKTFVRVRVGPRLCVWQAITGYSNGWTTR
jgi:hypothetical protein